MTILYQMGGIFRNSEFNPCIYIYYEIFSFFFWNISKKTTGKYYFKRTK